MTKITKDTILHAKNRTEHLRPVIALCFLKANIHGNATAGSVDSCPAKSTRHTLLR